MAQSYQLEAAKRTMTGKRVRRLRAEGQIPAVIYGTVVPEPVSITVDERSLMRTYQAIGGSTLLDLSLDGDTYTVYIRNLHMNPIKRSPIHAEFFAPNLQVAMTASVPLHIVGEPQDAKLVLMQTRDTIELRGLPRDLPGGVDIDVSGLAVVDDSIFVADLAVPEGIEIITDPGEMIVRLTEPQMVVDEDEVEAVEGEEVEGEAPAEAAGDDDDTSDEG